MEQQRNGRSLKTGEEKKNPAVLHRDDQKKENLKYVAE